MINLMNKYYASLDEMMKFVIENEKETIQEAANAMSNCKDNGKQIFFFGTGHSYIVSQEVFARAGGYAGFTPILLNELGMNHAFKSTLIERTMDYVDVIFGLYTFEKGDVVIITSNSGRNKLIVEFAKRLQEIGVIIISITALTESKKCTSRHHSGLRLFELSDIILDNQSAYGDACVAHNERISTGPTSTIMSCFIAQLLVSAFVQEEINKGKDVPVFISSNTDDGDKYNDKLFAMYK